MITSVRDLVSTPEAQAALAELRGLILTRYPAATFSTGPGEDPVGIYLRAEVDVANVDEVVETVLDRMVDLQVDDRLPVYVSVVRPVERAMQELQDQRAGETRLFSMATPLP